MRNYMLWRRKSHKIFCSTIKLSLARSSHVYIASFLNKFPISTNFFFCFYNHEIFPPFFLFICIFASFYFSLPKLPFFTLFIQTHSGSIKMSKLRKRSASEENKLQTFTICTKMKHTKKNREGKLH